MALCPVRLVTLPRRTKTYILLFLIILEFLHLGTQISNPKTRILLRSIFEQPKADDKHLHVVVGGKNKSKSFSLLMRKYKMTHSKNEKVNLRMGRYNAMCKGQGQSFEVIDEESLGDHFLVSDKQSILYCSVLKVGSTFWKRLLQVIDSGSVKSPYSINPRSANTNIKTLEGYPVETLTEKARTHTMLMFARNPYTRVLSAYLDKLYVANPYFWWNWGRSMKHKEETICYHDVTFQEFLKYVIEIEKLKSRKRDAHYASMYDLCRPCEIRYDFVGKMETFKQDLFFILDTLNLTEYKGVFRDFGNDAFEDSIWDMSHTFSDWKQDIKKCMSLYEAYLRTWRRLQIRGYISDGMKFPRNARQAKLMSREEFFDIVKSAHTKSKTMTNLDMQRDEMLHRIYMSIPKELVMEFTHVFHHDFDIFGYDIITEYNEQETDEFESDVFRFQDLK